MAGKRKSIPIPGRPGEYYVEMLSLHQEGMEYADNYVEPNGQRTLWCVICMREGVFHNPRFAIYA